MAKNIAARKDGSFVVISLAPSVNKTQVGPSVVPIPYPVTIDLNNENNFSDNVNFNGNPACRFDSDTTKVVGDEAGTLGGVKSGTQGAKAEPKDKSSSVKVNGKYLIRCNDMFYMNSKNTVGRLVLSPLPEVNITDQGLTDTSSDEDTSWLDDLWKKAEEIGKDASAGLDKLSELDKKYSIVTRLEGAAQLTFGCIETVTGVIGVIVPEPATTVGGVLLAANGADGAQAGLRQLISGETTSTLVETSINFAASATGVNANDAQLMMTAGSMISCNPASMEKGAFKAAKTIAKEEKLAKEGGELADAAKAASKESKAAEKAEDAADTAKKEKASGGNGGDDPKKKKSDDGGKVKGKEKTLSKRKGDCAEYLVEQTMLSKGYKNLMIGDKKASEILTNNIGHGIDHIMVDKIGNLVIAETKSNGSSLNKLQKKGGITYLKKQMTDMNEGLKGHGRYKIFSTYSNEKQRDIRKSLKSMEKSLRNKRVKSELYKVKLKDDADYTPVSNKKRCKEAKEFKAQNWE